MSTSIRQGEILVERWEPIVGFPSYSVSDMGRVRSRETGLFQQPYQTSGGVMLIRLRSVGGVKVTKKLSRLVCDAFQYNPDGYAQIVPKDGDKANCRLSNLVQIGDEEEYIKNLARRGGRRKKIIERPKKSLYQGIEADEAVVKVESPVETIEREVAEAVERVKTLGTKQPRVRKPKAKKQRKRYGSVRVIETGNEYASVAEMSRQLGLDPSTVSAMLGHRGRQKSHRGYTFEYVAQRLNETVEVKRAKRIMRPVRHIQTGEVYESQTEASRKLDLTQSHISAQLRGKMRTVKGHTFEYADVN